MLRLYSGFIQFTKGSIMRKLIAASLMVLTLTVTSTVLASPSTPPATVPPQQTTATNMPSSNVDNIEVPYDVWIYAQTQYQGMAITHANKITRGNKQAYRVRLDHDSTSEDFNSSMYLFYDANWQLIAEEKAFTPPAPQQDTPKPAEASDDSKDKKEDPPKPQAAKPASVSTETTTTQPATTATTTSQPSSNQTTQTQPATQTTQTTPTTQPPANN